MAYPFHEKVAKVQVLFNLLILALIFSATFLQQNGRGWRRSFRMMKFIRILVMILIYWIWMKRKRAELAAFENKHDSDSDSGDELDDENLPLFYHRCPQFEWTGGNYVPPAQNDNRPKYSRRSGPVRVLDASITLLECSNLFYTEQIFRDLVENTRRRKESDTDNNKGDWKMLTVDELKVYYGLVIMKDIIKLDRDAHYWHQAGKPPLH